MSDDRWTEYDLERESLNDSEPRPRCPLCGRPLWWPWAPGASVRCGGCGAEVRPGPVEVE